MNEAIPKDLSRIDLGRICSDLGLTEGPWMGHWHLSEDSLPQRTPFLEEEFFESACRRLRMDDEIAASLIGAAAAIPRRPALLRYFRHCRYLLLDREQFGHRQWMELPEPREESRLFFALVLLSVLLETLELHRRRGIPEQISLDTFSDLELWIRAYRQWHGVWGFGERTWLFHHFRGELYRLGRLQFLFEPFPDDVHVFRSDDKAHILLLAPDNVSYRQDGQFDGACGIQDIHPLRSRFQIGEDDYTGTLIAADGSITQKTLSLSRREWRPVLEKGAPALSFHIPAIGPVDLAECRKSFSQAMNFFAAHFPDRPFKAFFSHSWLYDRQLARYLPSDSNIVRFQREFYLYPLQGTDDRQILERVFDNRFRNLQDAPRETSLQKSVLAHMEDGGRWYTSGALLWPADIQPKLRQVK